MEDRVTFIGIEVEGKAMLMETDINSVMCQMEYLGEGSFKSRGFKSR